MPDRRKAVQPQRELSMPAPTPALLHDIPATAQLMSTTTWAVRTLCRSGQLKFVRVGHRWLISPEAIRAFIQSAERETAA
jgi:hypothetical protein